MTSGGGLSFDLTINIGHVLTVLAMIGAGFGFMMLIQRRLDAQALRMNHMELSLTQIAAETQQDVKQLTAVMLTQARHDERITSIDYRMLSQGRRLDEAIRRMNVFLDLKGAMAAEEDNT